MKLYQIEYLLAVGKYGSISKAADELLVSRPAVSRAIKELEEEFGVTFFLRTTTGVLLTEAGQLVFEKCKRFEQLFTELQTEIEALKSSAGADAARQLHIGISYTARSTITSFLSAFRREYPDITLRLTDLEDSFIDTGTLIPDYDLEIALSEDKTYDGVAYLDIADSTFVFCCSTNHRLAGRKLISITDIKDEPLGGINHIEQKGNQVTALFASHGLRPNITYMTQQVTFLQQMVRDGLCCCVKPLQSIECTDDVVAIPIAEAPVLRLRILWNDSIRHNSAFYDFVGFALRSLSQDHASAGESAASVHQKERKMNV